MSNKLDLLAQKEQQLRMLNEQLDKKKSNLLAAKVESEQEASDHDESQEKLDDSYEEDNFEQSTHKAKTLKGMALSGAHLDEDDDKLAGEEESKNQYQDYGEEDHNYK